MYLRFISNSPLKYHSISVYVLFSHHAVQMSNDGSLQSVVKSKSPVCVCVKVVMGTV